MVLGAGVGGLTWWEDCQFPGAGITLLDRQNHHLFQPLRYRVASAGLSAPDIAQPIRSILSDPKNVTVLLDNAVDFKLDSKQVVLEKEVLHYAYLVLWLGGITSSFSHPERAQFAPSFQSLYHPTPIPPETPHAS